MTETSRSPEILRLTQLLDRNPESRLFVPLAEAYLQSELAGEAIVVLSDGLKHHPMFVAARVMLGKIHLEQGAMPEAKAQFEQVLEVAPNNIPSLKGLAAIFREDGRHDEAKTLYQAILEVDPADKAAHALLDALDEDVLDEKEAAAEDGIEPVSEPHQTQTMAALYLSQGHFQEAADIYERLLKQNPADEASREGLEAALRALRGETREEDSRSLSVEKKIARLHEWLEVIQKNKRR